MRPSVRAAFAGVALVCLLAAASASAASVVNLCIGSKAGQGVKSGGEGAGKCPAPTIKITFRKVALPLDEAEQQKLLAILPYIKYTETGVAGKPTIQFSGVNIQIVNGAGTTLSANGTGNLIIGYGEHEPTNQQTGSHNVVLGYNQTFVSYGALLGGFNNGAMGPGASVLGGDQNTASGAYSTVAGGSYNEAIGDASSVSGGYVNSATGVTAAVSGGEHNVASFYHSSVSGGWGNTASGQDSAVAGGEGDKAEGMLSSILGGHALTATGLYETIP